MWGNQLGAGHLLPHHFTTTSVPEKGGNLERFRFLDIANSHIEEC